MNLAQLYQQHEHDKKLFEQTRDQIWKEMKDRHTNITEAFGKRENLPDGYAAKMDNEIKNFQKEWAKDTGSRHKEMIKQHKEQIKAITQKPKTERKPTMPKPKPANSNQGDKLSQEREKKKQELIRQQKAMLAKSREHKRKR